MFRIFNNFERIIYRHFLLNQTTKPKTDHSIFGSGCVHHHAVLATIFPKNLWPFESNSIWFSLFSKLDVFVRFRVYFRLQVSSRLQDDDVDQEHHWFSIWLQPQTNTIDKLTVVLAPHDILWFSTDVFLLYNWIYSIFDAFRPENFFFF